MFSDVQQQIAKFAHIEEVADVSDPGERIVLAERSYVLAKSANGRSGIYLLPFGKISARIERQNIRLRVIDIR